MAKLRIRSKQWKCHKDFRCENCHMTVGHMFMDCGGRRSVKIIMNDAIFTDMLPLSARGRGIEFIVPSSCANTQLAPVRHPSPNSFVFPSSVFIVFLFIFVHLQQFSAARPGRKMVKYYTLPSFSHSRHIN